MIGLLKSKLDVNRLLNDLPTQLRPELSTGVIKALIAVVFLLICAAFGGWSYNFYVFLRIAVTGMMVVALLRMYPRREIAWCVPIGLVALVYNPVAPFHLSKDNWRVLNVIAAMLITGLVVVANRSESESLLSTSGQRVNCPECERLDKLFVSIRVQRTLATAQGLQTNALDEKESETLGRIMAHKTEHARVGN